LRFVGYDAMTREQELDMIVKKVTNLITLDEAREEMGYKPLKREGISDNPMSSTYSQFMMMGQQQEQGQEEQFGGATGEDDMTDEQNPFSDDEPSDEEDENNPFN